MYDFKNTLRIREPVECRLINNLKEMKFSTRSYYNRVLYNTYNTYDAVIKVQADDCNNGIRDSKLAGLIVTNAQTYYYMHISF